jgi:hypothetical protein
MPRFSGQTKEFLADRSRQNLQTPSRRVVSGFGRSGMPGRAASTGHLQTSRRCPDSGSAIMEVWRQWVIQGQARPNGWPQTCSSSRGQGRACRSVNSPTLRTSPSPPSHGSNPVPGSRHCPFWRGSWPLSTWRCELRWPTTTPTTTCWMRRTIGCRQTSSPPSCKGAWPGRDRPGRVRPATDRRNVESTSRGLCLDRRVRRPRRADGPPPNSHGCAASAHRHAR